MIFDPVLSDRGAVSPGGRLGDHLPKGGRRMGDAPSRSCQAEKRGILPGDRAADRQAVSVFSMKTLNGSGE